VAEPSQVVTPELEAASIYDRAYYQSYKDQPYERAEVWTRLFQNFAARIVRDLRPKSALDAGCAMGFLVEALRDRGVEAYGFDVSDYALSQAREDIRPFLWRASAVTPLERDYDVIISTEVLEHLSPMEAEAAVENLCTHTTDIIFSSSPDDFRETTHVNVRGPEYWAELFAHHGFYRDVDYEVDYIAPWAVRFRKTGESVPRVIRGYERLRDRLAYENRELREVLVERHDAAVTAEETLKPTTEELKATLARLAEREAELAEREAELAESRTQLDAATAELKRLKSRPYWRARRLAEKEARRLLPADSKLGQLARRAKKTLGR
jgi:SAM-dependent methyltransferase